MTKQSILILWNIVFSRFDGACWQMNTTLYQNLSEDTQNWTNLYLEPHDYRIYYVNIDLVCHQYGISAAESQTFLRAKCPQQQRARRNAVKKIKLAICKIYVHERKKCYANVMTTNISQNCEI